jgi:hypothetical protein
VPESDSDTVHAESIDEAEEIIFDRHGSGDNEIEIERVKDMGPAKEFPYYDKRQLVFCEN